MTAQLPLFTLKQSGAKPAVVTIPDDEASRLIENLRTVAEAEGGTRRLRDLILELAFRGALVPQIPGEGTSEPLIRKLASVRQKLASVARVRADLPALTPDAQPFAVPSTWSWVRLGELGGFLGGGTPAKSNAAFWEGPIPWVSPKDMKRPYIDDAEDHISEAAVEGSAVKMIPSRSLLFVVRGMILAHSFPVALTTKKVTINQDMKALVLALPEMDEYLLRACWAARKRLLGRVERSSHGTCRLDSGVLEDLPIPLPPLAEQKRIVAKVDQLMALCDELEAKQAKKREVGDRLTKAALGALTSAEGPEEFEAAWKRVTENFEDLINRPENVGKFRETILMLAVQGHLDAPRQEDGSAQNVLDQAARFRAQLTQQVRSRQDTPSRTTPNTRNQPLALPPSWRLVPIRDFALVRGGKRLPAGSTFASSETPWAYIQVTNMKHGTIVRDGMRFIDATTRAMIEPYIIEKEDIYITIAGTIGQVGTVPGEYDGMNLTENAARIVFRGINRKYLLLALQSSYLQQQFVDKTNQLAQPKLALSRICDALVPIPPLPQQNRIVDRVEHLMKLCDDLEAKLRARDEKAAKLAAALVAEVVG